jgi:hypothetical protein
MLPPMRLLLVCVLTGVCANFVFSQGAPSSAARLTAPLGHVSKGGNFAILLPVDVTAQRLIGSSPGNRGGIQYFWRTSEGEFFVSFFDSTEKSADAKQELTAMSNNYLSGVTKNGGKLLEKKDLTLEPTYPGLQIKASLKTGETVVIRYYSVGKRTFIVSTRWNAKETGETQLKVLDSFKLLSSK